MPTLEAVQTEIMPAHPDYRTLPIEEGFDWPQIVRNQEKIRGNLTAKALYLVVFRSEKLPEADPEEIKSADDAAHDEARRSPDYMEYFQGDRDENDRALSMCLWRSARAAFEAVHGPDSVSHRYAADQAERFYGSNYSIEFYSLVPSDDGVLFVEHKHPQITHTYQEEVHA